MIQKFLSWLVVSSSDSSKVSLTIQGVLLQWAAIAVIAAQYAHVPLTNSQYVDFVGAFAGIIGTILGIVGLARKLYFELKPLFR